MATTNGRPQQVRGTEGRPAVTAPTLAGQVDRKLTDWKEHLIGLFPKDGEAAYKRAVAMAKDQARKMDPDTDPQSIVEGVISAMKLDLELGHDCYLVPFKDKKTGRKIATFITGPQGLIKLMFRSGFVKSVTARTVLRGDDFSYQLGTDEFIRHHRGPTRPIRPADVWREIVAAYCIIETSTGGRGIEVLERGDLEYYRSLSPSGQSEFGLWGKFPAEACRKTVLKQGGKFVPHSSQLAIALSTDADERSYDIPDEIMAGAMGGESSAGPDPLEAPALPEVYDGQTGEMRQPGSD